jgi:cytochrome c oxidase subunit 4
MASKDSHAEQEQIAHAGLGRYWIVWFLLLVGTLLTWLLARHVHIPPPFHLLTALLIASTKSILVVLFFMHLWDHGGANRLVFATSVFFVALLIFIVVLDNSTRFRLLNPGQPETMQMLPPGPDVLTPNGPPAPAPQNDVRARERAPAEH